VLRAAILSGLTLGGGHSQHKCPATIVGLKLLFVAASFITWLRRPDALRRSMEEWAKDPALPIETD